MEKFPKELSAFICFLILLLIILSGCSKNPVKQDNGNNYKGPSKIIVYLKDAKGKSIPEDYLNVDLEVLQGDKIKYIHYYAQTDKSGKAVVDSLPAGKYKIDYYYWKPENGYNFSYIKEVLLLENQIMELKINIPSKIDFKLVLSYYDNKNILPDSSKVLDDYEVKLTPGNYGGVCGDEGYTVLNNIPLRSYDIALNKSGISIKNSIGSFTYYNDKSEDLKIIIKNNKPEISIVSPDSNSYIDSRNIYLMCEGNDFEDGALPESSLIWNSDISGNLGTGRNLHPDNLTAGHHKITLTGTDTSGEKTEKTRDIYVTFSNNLSWYPFTINSYWNYNYNISELIVSYSGDQSEKWLLSKLKVSTEEANTRNSSMEYDIIRGDKTLRCNYDVIDYYWTDGVNVYVIKTVEKIKTMEFGSIEPLESIDIETDYSQKLLLIQNHTDLKPGDSYNSSLTASVKNVYYNKQFGSTTTHETIPLTTSFSAGEITRIETPAGIYDAIPLITDTNGSTKKWWLAKGIGIVRMDYKISGTNVSALLSETNINTGGSGKLSFNERYTGKVKLTTSQKPGTMGRMLDMARVLRSICPR